MNYMLPLYLDYLERPDIYEGLFYRELHVLGEICGLNDYIGESEDSLRRSYQRLATEPGGKKAVKLMGTHGAKAKQYKTKSALRKAYHRLATEPGGKKISAAAKAKKVADLKRRMKDAKALDKKTVAQGKTSIKKQLTTSKKLVKTKAPLKTSAGAAKKLKIAAQQTSKIDPNKKAAFKGLAKTLKPFAKKAAVVGAGAAAAYGGYKAYKRYFSKAAKKCRGKSGAEKTLCLKQSVGPKSYESDY